MDAAQTDLDPVRLGELLSGLVGRLDGAIDFWTLVCLMSDRQMGDRRGFILEKVAGLKSLVHQIDSLLADSGAAAKGGTAQQLNALAGACDNLEAAFLVLVQCRDVALEKVQSTVDQLRIARATIIEKVHALQQLFGLEVPYWSSQTLEQRTHMENILDHLFDTFRHTLAAEQTAPDVAGVRPKESGDQNVCAISC